MIVEKGCWERGCACYDHRVDKDWVEVVKKEWVGLTKAEFEEAVEDKEDLEDCWIAIEAKLQEKNSG